jgi:hypothetical protein
MITALEAERQRMNDRIQFLTRNRDAITAYIDAVRSTRTTATANGGKLRRGFPRRHATSWPRSCAGTLTD